MSTRPTINTLGEIKSTAYRPKTIQEELRINLIRSLQAGESAFEGILGYEETVIPDIERAILSGHSINLLGLRGQAKTRLARSLVNLLDEWIPILEGSELNEDPLHPILNSSIKKIEELGDSTPIEWMHRSQRYVEKLATPDVTVADLIGDLDPIKAANLKLSYADERVIHYGLVPRSNRCIFVINELPDLQPRIQVSLFNILQEGDIQIRGFRLRMPLNIQFVFTANPEDYTNRGSIITPLKDRIQSQIITHYPRSIEIGREISRQEARIKPEQKDKVEIGELLELLIEGLAFEARQSELVDQKSGVSARLSISALENLASAIERRAIVTGEQKAHGRVADLLAVIPAINGKVELVYEGEQEGPTYVAHRLISQSIRTRFPQIFPDPEAFKRKKVVSPYQPIIQWFSDFDLELTDQMSQAEYETALHSVSGLYDIVTKYVPEAKAEEKLLMMEFVLHGLAEYSLIGKSVLDQSISFGDIMQQMFSGGGDEDADNE
jgi:magnesium chelatase subunit I